MPPKAKAKNDTEKGYNGNPLKQWFITFPQSGSIEKHLLHTYFPPSTFVLTAKEDHEDGSPHLHMVIILTRGISKPTMKRWVEVKFPNDYKRIYHKPVESLQSVIDYCKKEDPSPYTQGDYGKRQRRKPDFLESGTSVPHTELSLDDRYRHTLYQEYCDEINFKIETLRQKYLARGFTDVEICICLEEYRRDLLEAALQKSQNFCF